MSAAERVPNIALIGFMGAGKSSVGRDLGARKGMPFLDLDGIIEENEALPIAEIFAARGEPYFREIEGLLFRRLCEGVGQIIGCGGGTLIDPRNRAVLEARCFSVWLRASVPEILRRIESEAAPVRPLIRGADPRIVVPALLRAREGAYRGADLVIDTDGRSVEEISLAIRAALPFPFRGPP